MALDYRSYAKQFEENGYVSPVPFLSEEEAIYHRARLEKIENQIGSLHYRSKAHTFMTSALELATCLLYTSPSPRDLSTSRMPSSA